MPLLIAGVTTLGLWRLAQFIRCFCTVLHAWLVLACLHLLSLVPYQYVTGLPRKTRVAAQGGR